VKILKLFVTSPSPNGKYEISVLLGVEEIGALIGSKQLTITGVTCLEIKAIEVPSFEPTSIAIVLVAG
jgi:hypothetical protein